MEVLQASCQHPLSRPALKWPARFVERVSAAPPAGFTCPATAAVVSGSPAAARASKHATLAGDLPDPNARRPLMTGSRQSFVIVCSALMLYCASALAAPSEPSAAVCCSSPADCATDEQCCAPWVISQPDCDPRLVGYCRTTCFPSGGGDEISTAQPDQVSLDEDSAAQRPAIGSQGDRVGTVSPANGDPGPRTGR
jgi:hypothetical protein